MTDDWKPALTEQEMLDRARALWQAHARREVARYRALVRRLCEVHEISTDEQIALSKDIWGHTWALWLFPEVHQWDMRFEGPDEMVRAYGAGTITDNSFREVFGRAGMDAYRDLAVAARFYYGASGAPEEGEQ